MFGIYEQNVKLNSLVRGSGVEWYFVPLNSEMWEDNDVNESERFALKLQQDPCYSRTGLATEISRVSQGWDIHYISCYKPHEADTVLEEQSNDEWLEWFFYKQGKDEAVMEQALESYDMQQEAAKLDAAPPVGEPAILKLMVPIYFHCTDKKDGTPIVVEKYIRAVYFGFETCIADTAAVYMCDHLFMDSEYAMDKAWEAWWDICYKGLIPFILNLELDQKKLKLYLKIVFSSWRYHITREGVKFDLLNCVINGCQSLTKSIKNNSWNV